MEIPVGFAQVNLVFAGGAAPTGAQMTFGLDVDAFAGSAASLAQLVTQAWINADLSAVQVNDIWLERVLVKFGPNASGDYGEHVQTVTGVDTDPGIAPNTAVLIRKRTGVGGRSGRGRMYMPGAPENVIGDGGALEPVYRLGVQTRIDDFRTELVAVNTVMVLLHAPGSPLDVPLPITETPVDSLAATQRRRLRR